MNYDAVIFDLYGTLVDFRPDDVYRKVNAQMAQVLGVPADKLRRAWMDCIHDRNLGQLGGIEETIAHVCGTLGARPEREAIGKAALMRLDIVKQNMAPRAGVAQTLSLLKKMGMKLGLVSDCFVEVPMTWPETEFAPFFHVPVFSCVEHVVKPSPTLYMAACDRLCVTPDRCVYVGDGGSHELTGARQVGMHPVLIRVGHDSHMDPWRPDAPNWDGQVIASIPEVLALVQGR